MQRSQIEALIAQYMGGGQPTAQAGMFTGPGDLFLTATGSPTSAATPALFDTNIAGLLRGTMHRANETDQNLTRIQSMFGVDKQAAASLIQLTPGLSNYVSTKTDMMGGAFSVAQAINPFMGTGSDAGLQMYKDFERYNNTLYESVSKRAASGDYQGIRNASDAGDILAFATQRGLMDTSKTFRDDAGNLQQVDSDQMVKRSEEVMERFDGLLEAGRKVFGPGARAADVMQRMEALGGSGAMLTQAGTDRAAQNVLQMRNASLMTDTSVEAMMQAQMGMTSQLESMGLDSNSARQISTRSTIEGAGRYRDAADIRNQIAKEFGVAGNTQSFETYQMMAAQNRARMLEGRDGMRTQATAYLEQRGMEVNDGNINQAIQNIGRTVGFSSVLEAGTMDGIIDEMDQKTTQQVMERVITRELNANYSKVDNVKAVRTYQAMRFNQGPKNAGAMARVREAVIGGDLGEVQALLGTEMTQNDLDQMRATEVMVASSDLIDTATAGVPDDVDLDKGARQGGLLVDNFFDRMVIDTEGKIAKNLKRVEGAQVTVIEDEEGIKALAGLSNEELEQGGIFLQRTREGDSKYWQVEDEKNARHGSEIIAEARNNTEGGLEGAIDGVLGKLMEMLRELFSEFDSDSKPGGAGFGAGGSV